MGNDVAMWRRLSLAGRIHKMIPAVQVEPVSLTELLTYEISILLFWNYHDSQHILAANAFSYMTPDWLAAVSPVHLKPG